MEPRTSNVCRAVYGCSVVESIVRRLRIRQDPLSCGGEWSAGRCEARVSDLVEAGTVAFSCGFQPSGVLVRLNA